MLSLPLPSPPLLHPEAWIVLIGNYQITLFLKPSRGDPLHLEKNPRVHKALLDWSVPASDCCPVTPFSPGHTLTILDFSQCLRQAKLASASGNLHCYSLCLERSSSRSWPALWILRCAPTAPFWAEVLILPAAECCWQQLAVETVGMPLTEGSWLAPSWGHLPSGWSV